MHVGKEANRIDEKIPVMGHSQYRRARKLVRACCNYDEGNCIALDDGYRDPHEAYGFVRTSVCVQSISYSLLCK